MSLCPSLQPIDDGVSTIVSAAAVAASSQWLSARCRTITTGEWSEPPEQRTALPISSLNTAHKPTLPGRCREVRST